MKNTIIPAVLTLLMAISLIAGCSKSNDSSYSDSGNESGQGGSMARFTIAGDYLYTVDHSDLKVISLETPSKPDYLKKVSVGFDIETIFSRGDQLLMGAQSGMYIYDITRPEFPQRLSKTVHITSCDPVVADDRYAYVTLNNASVGCNRGVNALEIYDISNPEYPALVKRFVGNELNLSSPKGLGIDGEKLFLCDGGLKVYDVSDPENPVWIDDTTAIPQVKGADAYDVIPMDGTLLMIGSDGFYQFDYSEYTGQPNEKVLKFLSKIEVKGGKR